LDGSAIEKYNYLRLFCLAVNMNEDQVDESILYKKGECQVCGKSAEFKIGEMHVCSTCKPTFMEEYDRIRKELKYDQTIEIIQQLKKLTKKLGKIIPEDIGPSLKETRQATHDQEEWVKDLANHILSKAIKKTRKINKH
jgi:hypothetical protein